MLTQLKDEVISLLMVLVLCVGVVIVSPFMLARSIHNKFKP